MTQQKADALKSSLYSELELMSEVSIKESIRRHEVLIANKQLEVDKMVAEIDKLVNDTAYNEYKRVLFNIKKQREWIIEAQNSVD